MRLLQATAFATLTLPLAAQQATPSPDTKAIFESTKAGTVIVLGGEGAGRLQSTASGVIVSKDGVILTALHAVKGAAEVQVRMANGDVFDRVELLGSDERRDIAALKISAGALPALEIGTTAKLVAGDAVYAVTNATQVIALHWVRGPRFKCRHRRTPAFRSQARRSAASILKMH